MNKTIENIQDTMVTKVEHRDVMTSVDKIILKVVERLEQEPYFY